MNDLYQRPSREEIAALFGRHVRARLTVRGWSIEELSRRTGDQTGNLSQAIRGIKCPLAIAGRIADALGVPLAEMLVPYTCATCAGTPPKGFRCLECGAETRAA